MNEELILKIEKTNLHLLEAYVEKISQEFGLQTSFYASIFTLADSLFEDFCELYQGQTVKLRFLQHFDKLELIWRLDSDNDLKLLYTSILDENSPNAALYGHICDSISLINNEITIVYLYSGLNTQLSKRRQDLLRHYLGSIPEKKSIYDSLSRN